MRSLFNRSDTDKSDLVKYPSARIRDNNGSGNGTAVNEATKGDFHQMLEKLMRLYGIAPNELPDNETNGFQLIDALSALASKNDYIYPLTTDGAVLSVDIKISFMKTNEFIVCLSGADKTTETTIKGSDNTTFAVTYSGNYKANEYVRVIKTGSGVSIIRIADWNSLGAMATELLFLKKASQAEENAGTIDTAGTTPLTNKTVFLRRVNGVDSSTYLASASQNGLISIDQFNLLSSIASSLPRNTGWFSGVNIDSGSPGSTYPRSGDIVSATIQTSSGGRQVIRCVFETPMDNLSFLVDTEIESQGTLANDVEIQREVFRPVSTTSFDIALRETSSVAQSLKIHCKVYQLS